MVNIVGELVYEIENIVTGEVESIYAARMIMYHADMEDKPVSKELMAHAVHSEARYELLEDLKGISGNATEGM